MESMMNIIFPQEAPRYCAQNLKLEFPALVNGERVNCAITVEALKEHFGAASLGRRDVCAAFKAHRPVIEQATSTVLKEIGKKSVVLRSGLLRFMALH